MKVMTIGEWKIKDESLVEEHEKLMKEWLDSSHNLSLEAGVTPNAVKYYKKLDTSLERIFIVDFDDIDHYYAWMKSLEEVTPEVDYYSKWIEMVTDKIHEDYASWEAITILK
jgi:hypothetical protein